MELGWVLAEVGEVERARAIEHDRGLRLPRLVEMTRALGRRGVVDLPEPRRKSRAFQIGEAVGQLVGVLLVIGLAIWLVRRHRRRAREPGRGSP